MAATLRAAVESALPYEAAGFLLGTRSRRRSRVSEVLIARSVVSGRGEFEIPDYELRRMRVWAKDRRLDILAIFHSHPSGCRELSRADSESLRHSEWPWIVVTRRPRDSSLCLTAYRQPAAGSRQSRQLKADS